MDTNREIEEVMLSIRKMTMFMDPVMKLMGVGTIMLLTQFARMRKEGKLTRREFQDFQEFAKLSEGKYSIVNIPVESAEGYTFLGKNAFNKELKELDRRQIRYYIMPDLNEADSFVQLAILDEDKEKFAAWNERYLFQKMSGGEHELRSLDAFTNGRTSLVSLPLEGKDSVFRADFQMLEINYAMLPDLRVGDGQIQLVIANNDMQKLEHWFKLYQQDCFKHGEDVPDMNTIDMETYKKTGNLTPEEYIHTADDEIKKINQKYDRAPGAVEQTMFAKEAMLQSDQTVAYTEYESDLRYQKFTINENTLVKPVAETQTGRVFSESMDEKGFFISRVPGTKGADLNYLVVPKEQVFCSDDKKTYTAFLEKAEKPIVMDRNFNIISGEKRKYAEELFNSHYNLSGKEQNITQSIRNNLPNRTANKLKAPAVPMKVK